MTFSIVAADLAAGEWGVAVASKFLAAGAVVPWARAGAGAIATQAYANLAYGPDGLDLLAGASARETVERLTGADEGREQRQIGIVDRNGEAAAFTGSECFDWAGHLVGKGFTCQGNILTGKDVVEEMAAAFRSTNGELATRLLAALRAGDEAGGDSRGRQAAGILVVRSGGGYLGETDVAVDLRVDDHTAPVGELERLHSIHRLLFPNPDQLDFRPVDPDLARSIARALTERGHPVVAEDFADLRDALFTWVGTENLEMRWSEDDMVEVEVLRALGVD